MSKTTASNGKKNPDELVRGFVPNADFVGRPFPGGPEMSFKAGIMSPPVPQSWIDSLSEKKVDPETAAAHG